MAIGSVNQLIYLPGQIIYRYTAIRQIVATIREVEKNTMDIFKASPALAPQREQNRLLGNAVAVLFQGKASYYMSLSGQSMAIPVPGVGQTSSLAPKSIACRYLPRQTAKQAKRCRRWR